jgi:predicted cobalt transporter CbtA
MISRRRWLQISAASMLAAPTLAAGPQAALAQTPAPAQAPTQFKDAAISVRE